MNIIENNSIEEINLKNSKVNLKNHLISGETIQYTTWSRDAELSIDFDIILTNRRIIVISCDYVDSFIYKKINHLHIYYGDISEDYNENYIAYVGHWGFGTGSIYVIFNLDSSDYFSVAFPSGRFDEAKQFYEELSSLWLERT